MPATVLFLSANPSSTKQLDLDEEYRDIEDERMRARLRDQFELRPVLAARIDEERTELLLNDDAGRPAPVPIEALAELFRLEGGSVRCVVLNACVSLEQARAVARHVDCAVGTSRAITDKAAVAFSKGLYGALFNGDSIEKAFASGRNAVDLLRLDDSRVFEIVPRLPGTWEKLRLAELPDTPFKEAAVTLLLSQRKAREPADAPTLARGGHAG